MAPAKCDQLHVEAIVRLCLPNGSNVRTPATQSASYLTSSRTHISEIRGQIKATTSDPPNPLLFYYLQYLQYLRIPATFIWIVRRQMSPVLWVTLRQTRTHSYALVWVRAWPKMWCALLVFSGKCFNGKHKYCEAQSSALWPVMCSALNRTPYVQHVHIVSGQPHQNTCVLITLCVELHIKWSKWKTHKTPCVRTMSANRRQHF